MLPDTDIKSFLKSTQCCVLIPTYNNAATLKDVIDSVARYSEDIIVVNDGSTDATLEILANLKSVDLLSFPTNEGKGITLRRGFEYAYNKGFKYAISIDSDGQHYADDLPQFAKILKEEKNSIVVGARNMGQAGIPRKSSFGHKFSNFWFRLETGIDLPDTQSGYRLYPLVPLNAIKFYTNKFEFEIEVMVRAAWNGVKVTSVPVKVFYPPAGERVTHFRPFKDFTRITVLNTVLVILAVLYHIPLRIYRDLRKRKLKQLIYEAFNQTNDTNLKKSYAISFGIFMGIFPVWGYQMITAAAIAHVLKLNKVLVLLASNISIGPMMPLILFASYATGALLLGKDINLISENLSWEVLKENIYQYLIGSIVFASAAALFFGLISFAGFSLYRKKPVKQI